jgi:elongation factor Ts
MATVTPDLIKEVREKTGAGMLDCKKSLVKSDGDVDKAIKLLREKGLAQASKRMGRQTKAGRIFSYIHSVGNIGVLLELNCETDFVAKNDDFGKLGKNICMQIAASNPIAVTIEELSPEVIQQEKDIYKKQLLDEGKPEKVIDKIIKGKLKKFYSEVVLLEQPYIKELKQTVTDVIKASISSFGENITVGRFSRFEVGK